MAALESGVNIKNRPSLTVVIENATGLERKTLRNLSSEILRLCSERSSGFFAS